MLYYTKIYIVIRVEYIKSTIKSKLTDGIAEVINSEEVEFVVVLT